MFIHICVIVCGLYLKYESKWLPEKPEFKPNITCIILGASLSTLQQDEATVIIIFCFLVLGVSSQRWTTFLKEAGQGKGLKLWQGALYLPGPKFYVSRRHIPSGQMTQYVEKECSAYTALINWNIFDICHCVDWACTIFLILYIL